jgi:acetylornithine deacetylase/succinyl-diaminopimelate desuccinylase-like protein
VVPADPRTWTVDPFGGEIADGMVWGRGAVDMKDTDAVIISVVRHWARAGIQPERDVVVVFTPDEEAGSRHGATWLVHNRPEIFHGVTEAIGEVGGFSVSLSEQRRLYLIQTAERGYAWLRLVAQGRAGHGSLLREDNVVTEISEAVAKVGRHRFDVEMTPTVRRMIGEVADILEIQGDEQVRAEGVCAALGTFVSSALRNTANPTVLRAGYKHNVIPERAEALIDGRVVPGREDDFLKAIADLVGPDIEIVPDHVEPGYESPIDTPLVKRMAESLVAYDPGAVAVPYQLPAGTDAKSFRRIGIECYGFAPLRLPADLNFAAMFHGVDERVPIESLHFSVDVFDHFLRGA